MRPEDAVRLRRLEKENSRLKRVVADQALHIAMIREVTRETSDPGAPSLGRQKALRPLGVSERRACQAMA